MEFIGALDWSDEKDDQPITCNTRTKKLYRCDGDKDFILMQFTGLLDKNGKEIYEGDCLAGGGHIVWDERRGAWAIKQGESQHLMYENWQQPFACEIIGNIYSNPDLLK